MTIGDLTPSDPTYCTGALAVSTHILTLSLSDATDFLKIIPVPERNDTYLVFKVEREG